MNKRKLVTDRRPGWQGPYGAVDMNEEVSSSEKLNDAIENWVDSLPDVEQQLINAKRRAKLLEEGPGGIMEMKQTIADKELEIDRLQKYEVFAIMIANEPWELSYEKIEWQRNWWSKLARGLVKELENDHE
jgi:hypothetical protein